MDDDWFLEKLQELDEASRQESDHIKQVVAQIVPTYHYRPGKKEQYIAPL